jgi:hypothetical protein
LFPHKSDSTPYDTELFPIAYRPKVLFLFH